MYIGVFFEEVSSACIIEQIIYEVAVDRDRDIDLRSECSFPYNRLSYNGVLMLLS